MNCRKCGIPVGPQQGICPSCGTPVQDVNSVSNNNMTNMLGIPNVTGVSNDVNVPNMQNVPDTSNMQGMMDMSGMQNMAGSVNMQGMVNMPTMNQNDYTMNMQNNSMMNFMEPTNVNLATDAKRNVSVPQNNQSMYVNQNNNSGNNMFNVMEPTNVNLASDARKNANTQTGQHIVPNVMASSLVNPPNPPEMNMNQMNNMNQSQSNGEQNGMYFGNLELPDEGKKKHFPWFVMAIILVAVMIGGVFILPQFNKLNLSTYDGDQYTLQYNANWSVDDEKEDMALYYSDKNSRFIFNALSTFTALNSSVENDASKKDLYNQFYNAWSDLDGGELTGGTETFLPLNAETLYARVDFVITRDNSVGSFYVIVSEKNDKVISFMTYCTADNKDQIDKDVVDMLETLTYKKESESSVYNKFKSGETKAYNALGYMKYDVPECWEYDETRTKSVQYKSNVFKFIDGTTLLDIKGVTPYSSSLGVAGTTYESMKATITKSYGAIKEEKTKTIKGKVWYIVITPDYDAGGMSYHNEIYFTMSATNKHLYYIEAYVSNETSAKKTKYLNESIEYIINSATLYKVNE